MGNILIKFDKKRHVCFGGDALEQFSDICSGNQSFQ